MASPLKGWLHAPAESSDTMPIQLPPTVENMGQIRIHTSTQNPEDAPYVKVRSYASGFGSTYGPVVMFEWTNYADHDAGIDYGIEILPTEA